MAHQGFEQLIFARGEFQWRAAQRRAARGRRDLQHAQADRRFDLSVSATQQRAQAGGQLFQVHRLDHVIVGTGIQPGDAVGQFVARGEQQYRGGIAALAHAGDDRRPAAARQVPVQHRRGVGRVGQRRGGLGTVGDPVHRIAEQAQALGQRLPQCPVVLG